jgi:Arylsulfotransferase (ASST)
MNPRRCLAAISTPVLIAIAGLPAWGIAADAAQGAGVAAAYARVPAAHTVTVSPLPGTLTALPRTQISFLGAPVSELRNVAVVGSSTGKHTGHLKAYAAATGASFIPHVAFKPGERVRVTATLETSKGARSIATTFTVAQPATVAQTEFPSVPGTPADIQTFKSQPNLHPPTVTVHTAASSPAPGYVFASPALGPGQDGPMIFDNAGNLVWFRSLPTGQDAADFRTQTYQGHTDLTWWQGRTLMLGYGLGEDIIADSHYKTVARVKAGNGLQADEHEFTITPKGVALITAYSPVAENLSAVGGAASAIAVEGVVQEVDIKTGLVMWEWHSLGHVEPAESYSKASTIATTPFDYFHINSLALDAHGNLLVSARNTWALYSVSARTGAVIWRLGGKKSSFTLGAGVAFAYQHNAQFLPNGDVSLFDDEGAPPVKPPSRGELIKLNLQTKTATLDGQLVRNPGPLVTGSQGNVQSLPGGGWMVGWGGLPNFTEFNAQGQVVFDAQLPGGENSYRVYREVWSAQPTELPTIAATTAAGTTTAYASWNGATDVASWQLLAGSTTTDLAVVASAPRSGFETALATPAAAYVEVRALSAAGKTLATSKAIAPTAG